MSATPLETLSSEAYWDGKYCPALDEKIFNHGTLPSSNFVEERIIANLSRAVESAAGYPLADGVPVGSAVSVIPEYFRDREWLLATVEDTRRRGWSTIAERVSFARQALDPDRFNELAEQILDRFSLQEAARTSVTADTGEKHALSRQVVFYLGSTAVRPGTWNGRPTLSGMPAAELGKRRSILGLRQRMTLLAAELAVGGTYMDKSGNSRVRIPRAMVIVPTLPEVERKQRDRGQVPSRVTPAFMPVPSV